MIDKLDGEFPEPFLLLLLTCCCRRVVVKLTVDLLVERKDGVVGVVVTLSSFILFLLSCRCLVSEML